MSPGMLAALECGDRAVREVEALMERGTDEEIWADRVMRGAAVRWDILKRRALYPVVEPTQAMLWANAERLKKEKIYPPADGGRGPGLLTSTHGPASSGNLCRASRRGGL